MRAQVSSPIIVRLMASVALLFQFDRNPKASQSHQHRMTTNTGVSLQWLPQTIVGTTLAKGSPLTMREPALFQHHRHR
jgi:hypothetical protein